MAAYNLVDNSNNRIYNIAGTAGESFCHRSIKKGNNFREIFMGKTKKLDVISIVIMAVLGLALVMTIVGICINWLGLTTEKVFGNGTNTEMWKLSKLIKDNNDADKELYSGIDAVNAFAIISVILSALTLISFIASKFLDVKALKFVVIALSALLIVFALITLILTFTCTNTDVCEIVKKAGGKYAPAAGAWLLTIFGIMGGAAGVVGALKK